MRPSLRHSSPLQCRRRLAAALALVGVGLVATAGTLVVTAPSSGASIDRRAQMERALPVPTARAVAAAIAAVKETARKPAPVRHPKNRTPIRAQMPAPKRIIIPAISVSAKIIPLGLNRDRTIQVPRSFKVAGWFRPGPEPGEKGAAIIIGHVDSFRGPGVFFHLRALRRGDRIKVVLKTTKTKKKAKKAKSPKSLQFIVTSTREVSKQRFPTKLVYGRTRRPTLRLVTCGGQFNLKTHHYLNNFIVFAALVGRR